MKIKVEYCKWDKRRERKSERKKEEGPAPLLLLPFLFISEDDVQTTELRASGLTLWDVHLKSRQNNLKRSIKGQ